MSITNIQESFTLPSKGLIYDVPINPNLTMRSMTTCEEMKRLSKSEYPLRQMCEIIEDCLITKPDISVYDMCLADYQYLMFKLRTITYGSDYSMTAICPICNKVQTVKLNLDDLEVKTFSEDILKYFRVHLPKSNVDVELRLQTPRIMDNISRRKKELEKLSPKSGDVTYMLEVENLIKTYDGKSLTEIELEQVVKQMPMYDVNILVQTNMQIQKELGIIPLVNIDCEGCGAKLPVQFQFNRDFFSPRVY